MTVSSIAVISDVVCPWCYLGKRRLERALEELNMTAEARITWLPFELNPDMPPGGMERRAYRAAKFGPERSADLDEQMTALGRAEGVAFAFDRQQRTPNTRLAHMLIGYAQRIGEADQVVDALFRAYFEEGLDVGSPEVLAAVAERAGIDRAAAAGALQDEGLRKQVLQHEREAGRIGVSGVPFFIVNETWAVSGAQPTAQWAQALREIRSRAPDDRIRQGAGGRR